MGCLIMLCTNWLSMSLWGLVHFTKPPAGRYLSGTHVPGAQKRQRAEKVCPFTYTIIWEVKQTLKSCRLA